MTRSGLAGVFETFGQTSLATKPLPRGAAKVWRAILACRTAALGGPESVLEYLGRYTHRVAISNERIVAIAGEDVLIRVRADPESGKKRTVRIPGTEFIDRFLMHVLPSGFKRTRHYGCGTYRVVAAILPAHLHPGPRGLPCRIMPSN